LTDNPEKVLKAIDAGNILIRTPEQARIEDLHVDGLYISEHPQLWKGRVRDKWKKVETLSDGDFNKLLDVLEGEIDEKRSGGWVSEGEAERAKRDIGYMRSGDYGRNVVAHVIGQPYNIRIFSREFADAYGVDLTYDLRGIYIEAEGKFADVSDVDLDEGLMAGLKGEGFDGATTRGSMGRTQQSVIWNPQVIKNTSVESLPSSRGFR
jgi:hypothetical protein